MVLGQPLDVVVERVQPGSRHDPCLTHRTTEAVLLDPRAPHQLVRACDQRAERAAEPFREAEGDGVEEAGDLGRGNAESRRLRS